MWIVAEICIIRSCSAFDICSTGAKNERQHVHTYRIDASLKTQSGRVNGTHKIKERNQRDVQFGGD